MATDSSPALFDLATVSKNGKAPASKITTAEQAYAIADEFKRFDETRRKKRIAIYKSYQGFPPSSYSALVKEGAEWQHNVNWRQLKFRVDNQKTSFIDLITEKNLIANIETKYSKSTGEDVKYSELISQGYDRMMRGWDGYLLNNEQDLQDMLLYGKGVELSDEVEGFLSHHADAGDFLVPDNANVDFSNVEVCVRMREYSPNQLWDKFKDKKKSADAETVGWNRLACIEAMREHLSTGVNRLTTEQVYHKIAAGDVNVLAMANKKIKVYEVYVREFTGKISKHVVLQDYGPVKSRNPNVKRMKEGDYIDKSGYLFTKTGMFESWSDLISMFTDSAGSGKWHEIIGFGDSIYIQCRSYDMDMNRIHDAIYINMCAIFKGDTAQATKVMREVGLKPYAVMPSDWAPQQIHFNIPVQESLAVLQKVQNDTDAGSGAYRVSADTQGPEKTLGERQLDAAESAKLSGVQVRRYNEWQTIFHRKTFYRMLDCKKGEKDYEIKKVFIDFMEENNVPPEAYKKENITKIESNMISGAGSPSYKLMAAEKTIAVLNVSPTSKGQEQAIQDYVAALNGRQNVNRYMPDTKVDVTDVQRTIAFENTGLSDAYADPANFPVSPRDPQMLHIQGHLASISFDFNIIESLAGNQKLDRASEVLAGAGNKFNHTGQHVALLSQDEGKKDTLAKQAEQFLAEVKRQLDGIAAEITKMLAAKQEESGEGKTDEQRQLEFQTAMDQIRVHTAQQLSDIKLADRSLTHQQKLENSREQSATKIAANRLLTDQKALKDQPTNRIAESIQFSDLPPKAKVQMLAQVGIVVTEEDFAEEPEEKTEKPE